MHCPPEAPAGSPVLPVHSPALASPAHPHCTPRLLPNPPAELTDALSVAADQLADAQQAFLLLPLEASPEGLLQQTHLLSKLTALSAFWSSATFCYRCAYFNGRVFFRGV